MPAYQPKFTVVTRRYVRRELLRLLREKYLPLLVRHVQWQPADGMEWQPFKTMIALGRLRPGVEALAAMPAARRDAIGPAERQLRDYERQLTAWKRRRTIARTKVAKYARLVRYHRAKQGSQTVISDPQ
jgi:hypothetical protein